MAESGRILPLSTHEEMTPPYRVIFDEAPVSMILHDKDTGAILDANRSAWLAYGLTSLDELRHYPIWEESPYSEEEALAAIRRCAAEGAQVFEWRSRRRSGERFWEQVRLQPVRLEGHLRVLATCTDITEQRRTEENLRHMEKMSAIGQLAGGIAHNFNNQLTGVIGYAHLLQSFIQDPKLRGYVDKLLIGAKRSAELTRQMLSFARMDVGAFKPVNLHDLVHEVLGILHHTFPSFITVREELHAPESWIACNASQIQSAILNLAINARDAMPEGGELVFGTSITTLDGNTGCPLLDSAPVGRHICLTITDTGTGIEAGDLPHIFEPFFTTKAPGKGTGMGLSTVYGTIQLHKGAIEVDSEPGRGTTFTVSLPLLPPLVGEPDMEASEMVRAPYPARILLVEDDETIRSLTADMLVELGYRVEVCRDGAEGLAYYTAHADGIDLVILDLVIPRIGGVEVFRAMERLHPEVRVIFASGYGIHTVPAGLLDGETRIFLQKPVEPHVLSQTVARMLTSP